MVRAGIALITFFFAGACIAAPPVPAFTTPTRVSIIKVSDKGYPQEEPFLAGSPQGALYLSLPHTRALYRSDDRAASWLTLFDTRFGAGQPNDGGTADGAIADAGLGVVHWLGLLGAHPVSYQRSVDSGLHWSAPMALDTIASPDRQWIAGDAAGNVIAVWEDKATQQAVSRHSSDNGRTGSDAQLITSAWAYAGAPARGALAGEFFVPMSINNGPDSFCLEVARTRDSGRTWKLSKCIRYIGGLMGSNTAPGPLVVNFTFLAA